MSVSVATMNYQDYAALQNSLNSYLQSSADNEEVTLPSNLTMENINAAIQSEGSHHCVWIKYQVKSFAICETTITCTCIHNKLL